ncbi:hypothetical protein QAD02_013574 [Eretmocerus hayati]|uniref:Uncharacterized protein n=1 Tax=Eretmocerus hayati TaxID=131215 RepID=A0ACC2P5S3_9HYME|nr:hypothetical protein QAD02_013574 [Eretmocerus hayati]
MRTIQPICVFCESRKKDVDVILFNEKSLEKCISILEIKKKNGLTGQNARLPLSANDKQGYHSKCRSNFLAVNAKYKTKANEIAEQIRCNEPTLQQDRVTLPAPLGIIERCEAKGDNVPNEQNSQDVSILDQSLDHRLVSGINQVASSTLVSPNKLYAMTTKDSEDEINNCTNETCSTIELSPSPMRDLCEDVGHMVENEQYRNTAIDAQCFDVTIPTTLKEVRMAQPESSSIEPNSFVSREKMCKDSSFCSQNEQPDFEGPSQTSRNSVDPSTESQTDDAETLSTHQESGEKLIVEDVYIFCSKTRKKFHGRDQDLRSSSEAVIENFRSQATELNDSDILNNISRRDSQNERILYHHICKVNFENTFKSSMKTRAEKSNTTKQRDTRLIAFQQVCSFVNENIIKKHKVYFLEFLENMYVQRQAEMYAIKEDGDGTVSSRYLKDRLNSHFPTEISIVTVNNRKLVKPRGAIVISDQAGITNLAEEDIVLQAALILRKKILSIEKKPLPDDLKTSSLIAGECDIPKILDDFLKTMLSGGHSRRLRNKMCRRQVDSISQDLIYAVSNARIKPSKHIVLGITLKSLTNSRKVIDVINRYGHCCSYSTLEGIETEATFSASSSSDVCPPDISRKGNLCTGVAWDNSDGFVDTINGKDTRHDTVGIIFQLEDESLENVQENLDGGSNSSRKRRRMYDAVEPELESYTKKPKLAGHLLRPSFIVQLPEPKNFRSVRQIDFLLLLSHALKIEGTSMFVGWNSLITKDMFKKQIISYLTTINHSPTNINVVIETMKQSLKIADECGQQYMEVTYDLAIAKVALQLQCTEKSLYSRLFIHVGPFHIMMSYFKAIGKFIENCGLTNIMVNSELIASGSVSSFLTGKHFNRCKRLHPLVSVAIEQLHFESFLESSKFKITDRMKDYVIGFKENRAIEPQIENERVLELFEEYEKYRKKTLKGSHGKTAQYYMLYVKLVQYYLILKRSVCTSNFELFKYILPKINNLFFTFNHQNYARYLVVYSNNLMRIDETHPGLREQFEKGSLGIRRTGKPFSKQPIDLTLEQTINADAESKLTGIINSSNSISARQRWCKFHSIKMAIISHVMEVTGLRKKQDVTADLQPSRIKRYSEQLSRFIEQIRQNINPFANHLQKDKLYNISSGQSANEKVTDFLLSVENFGQELRENFTEESADDESRLERAINRVKIQTFATAVKKTVKIAGKLVEVKIQRDLFGRLLAISLKKNLDFRKVLTHPLTPVPLSLCHMDGAIFTKKKAARVVVSFDQYFEPSVKDYEHTLRSTVRQDDYQIDGRHQVRQSNLSKELRNISFKEALVNFIIKDWTHPRLIPFFDNREIYVSHKSCFSFQKVDDKIIRTEVPSLATPLHEESDTKLVFHACQAQPESNVVVRCSDTDILVIMLGSMKSLNRNVKVWLDMGVGNHEKIIDVNSMYNKLGESVCRALPAFHAFTGCDSNPSFFMKGKKRPFSIMKGNPDFVEAFSNLSDCSDIGSSNTFRFNLEKFVCSMYGCKKMSEVDEARLFLFEKAFGCRNEQEQFNKMKTFDGSKLPPCKLELQQHIKRTIYIAKIWSNAHLQKPSELSATDHGWIEVDGKLHFKWFEGDQVPSSVGDVLTQEHTVPPGSAEDGRIEEDCDDEYLDVEGEHVHYDSGDSSDEDDPDSLSD